MKLTRRENYRPYDASYHDDWTEVWIQYDVYKRKYWLFGDWVKDEETSIVLGPSESDGRYPIEFKSFVEAEEYIKNLLS